PVITPAHSAGASRAPSLPAALMEGMGTANLPITTSSPQAQRFFNQGVAQLYAFWFREAERSFMQAAALDPAAAMAYWGIARSAAGDALPAYQLGTGLNRPISPPGPASPEARARDAIDKARALGAKVSDRERLYIEAEASRRNPNAQNPGGDFIRIMHRL